jgi:hypothetical protein
MKKENSGNSLPECRPKQHEKGILNRVIKATLSPKIFVSIALNPCAIKTIRHP